MSDKRCKCPMSISVLGDGCRYCQPQEHIDRLIEQIKDNENDLRKTAMGIKDFFIEDFKHLLKNYGATISANDYCVRNSEYWEGYAECEQDIRITIAFDDLGTTDIEFGKCITYENLGESK